VPVQSDGDAFGTTPIEVHAGTRDIRLILPKPNDPDPALTFH
jgi:hypothetical protein